MKHVHSHDEGTNLSKQILSEQMKNNWPGTSQTALAICQELSIDGIFDSNITKNQFKLKVKEACQKANDAELLSIIAGYKKMSAIRDELRKGNSYFYSETLQNVRILFRFRVELYESKMNFKNKYRGNYLCDSCESESDVSTHVLYCPAYSALRENKSLNNDRHLAEYLHKVLEIRTTIGINR